MNSMIITLLKKPSDTYLWRYCKKESKRPAFTFGGKTARKFYSKALQVHICVYLLHAVRCDFNAM